MQTNIGKQLAFFFFEVTETECRCATEMDGNSDRGPYRIITLLISETERRHGKAIM